MSKRNHSMCTHCWVREQHVQSIENGEILIPAPARVLQAPMESCCFCRRYTMAGIYVRRDPKDAICSGVHVGDEEEEDGKTTS
jgi:uncharacterized protein YrrD